ncbi:hypothetical protein CONLIGDRAFT_640831 [Coniochaeta ligniaria NRRL 30616]|uniref:60S ribosomal protein L29 n=1 Tax=Coniochaeta ligniaria NRRL 30616 TaxID=1408157 RepID=A0A1J7J2N6_9PEZI|nr:hypothetical protein CONLIGDRAFT_640831 [Coniochaeta ligniaria NRRL 30616]
MDLLKVAAGLIDKNGAVMVPGLGSWKCGWSCTSHSTPRISQRTILFEANSLKLPPVTSADILDLPRRKPGNRQNGQVQELVSAQPVEEGSPERDRITDTDNHCSIKKPKTSRYPSLKGTDPKFRRNHRHALHGTMKALKELKEGKRETA